MYIFNFLIVRKIVLYLREKKRRKGEKEKRRKGEKEKRRKGEEEKGRKGEEENLRKSVKSASSACYSLPQRTQRKRKGRKEKLHLSTYKPLNFDL